MKRFQDRSDVTEFRSLGDGTCQRILNQLKTINLCFRKVYVKRIAIVKPGVNKRSSNSAGSGVVYAWSNSAKVTNLQVASFGKRGNVFRK